MKFYFFNLTILFLLLILVLVNAQLKPILISPTIELNENIIIPNQEYISYPISSGYLGGCQLNFRYLITDTSSIDSGDGGGIEIVNSTVSTSILTTELILKDGKSSIYNILITIPIGTFNYNFTIYSIDKISSSIYNINTTCEKFNLQSINAYFLSKPSFDGKYYFAPIQIDGLNNTINNIDSNGYDMINFGKNLYYYRWRENYILNNLLSDWEVILFFNDKNITIKTTSYYNDLNNEELSEFKNYPNDISTQIGTFQEIGTSNTPLFSFKSNSTINKPFHCMIINNNGDDGYFNTRPISGTIGNLKYIGNFPNYNFQKSNFTPINFKFNNQLNSKSINYFNYDISSNIFLPDQLKSGSPNNFQFIDNPMVTVPFEGGIYNFNILEYSFIGNSYIRGFPFGFVGGNNLNYKHAVTIQTALNSSFEAKLQSYNIISLPNQVSFYAINPFDSKASNEKPKVLSFNFNQLNGPIYLLRISLFDNSGIKSIFTYENGTIQKYFGFQQLVEGDLKNGTYELILNSLNGIGLKIYDNSQNFIELLSGDYISLNPLIKYELPNNTVSYNSFNNISFLYNNLNLLNKTCYNVFYFNSSDIQHDTPMMLIINDPISKSKQLTESNTNLLDTELGVPIYWNESIKMFNSKFILSSNNIFGEIDYTILIGNTRLHSIGFYNSTSNNNNTNSKLIVTSSYLDNQGPIISNIQKINDSISIGSNGDKIGWKFNITDEYNGFESGFIKVMGSIDSSSFYFNFTLDNSTTNPLSSSNIWNSEYEIYIDINSPCISQEYTIVYIELTDKNQLKSIFNLYSKISNPISNPLINYLNDTKQVTSISFTCQNEIIDLTEPVLLSFQVSKTIIDVGSNDRSLSFKLKAYDEESGIRIDQTPIIYLIGKRMEIIETPFKIESINSTNATYVADIIVPVGFGYPEKIFFSIYGLINNAGLYSGVSSTQLMSLGGLRTSYNIETTMSSNQPFILSSEKISSDGGVLIIYGKSFINVDKVLINYTEDIDAGFISVVTSKIYSSTIVIENSKPTTHPIIIKVLLSNLLESNEFIIYPYYFNSTIEPEPTPEPTPTETPTETPEPTQTNEPPTPTPTNSSDEPSIPTNEPQKCINNCGGEKQGYCSTTGCVCFSPWIGSSCNSQVIPIPLPDFNNTDPSFEIPVIKNDTTNGGGDVTNILFKSLISIVSLRELDYNDQILKTFLFDKWISTEINQYKSKYVTSITTAASSNSTSTSTDITVILEWFTNLSIIEFAGTNLTMNPSTVKYTVTIGSYPFINSLNRLELIMSASVQSINDQVCLVDEFGSTSNGDNSNYIKLQIDDHSLYGRFIKRAIVDSKFKSVSNILLDSSFNPIINSDHSNSGITSSSIQRYIAIVLPNYKESIIIDPDFSVLLDSSNASNNENSICFSSSKKLSTAQLAGIIVGSVGFASVAVISLVYFLIKRKRDKKFVNNMQQRISSKNK